MFHVEISQETTHVRVFNLTEDDVRRRFLAPLSGRQRFVCEDKEFDPGAARLLVLEGPRLRLDQLTLGRGWTEAVRLGRDVTEAFLAEPGPMATSDGTPAAPDGPRDALEQRILGRLSAGATPLRALPMIAAELMSGSRASAQLAQTETVVWELLHRGHAALRSGGRDLPQAEWEEALLDPESWFGTREITAHPRGQGQERGDQ